MQQIEAIEPLPRGSRLIHIGPPKTGTTTLQGALHLRRKDLADHGVAFPGRKRHDRSAVAAAAYDDIPTVYPPGIEKGWQRLSEAVRSSEADRVVLSSETLSLASDARVARIVEDLGGERLQVVITMRPLARVLSSKWQQQIQSNYPVGFEEWLGMVFAPGAEDTPEIGRVWRRFRIDRLIQRWGAHVGEENVTLVVLDPVDRSMLLHTFEGLLGLPADFLTPDPHLSNFSLPYPEVEMLRAFNQRFRAAGHDRALHVRAVRKGALRQIKAAGQSVMPAYPIETPGWAVERANEVAIEMTEAVQASGARVIGDLAHLLTPVPEAEPRAVPTTVSVDSAAEIAYAMFLAGHTRALGQRRRPQPPAVAQVPARELARALLGRVVRRLGVGRG